MNLHAVVQGAIAAVNPPTTLTIQQSTGATINPDFSQTPTYASVTIVGDMQGLDAAALRMVEALNIQGVSRRVWVNGQYAGIVRAAHRGGDLVTTPDGAIWKITAVPEGWDTGGWCSFIMTEQNGS